MSDAGKLIEFPPESGRRAFYSPAERKMMSALLASAQEAGDPVIPQMRTLHDLKVDLGVDLVLDARELGDTEDGDIVIGGTDG